jgi:hypothetical protein
MMRSEVYKNKKYYISLMRSFVKFEINGERFYRDFMSQRSEDINKENKDLFFVRDASEASEELISQWYQGQLSLEEYAKKAFLISDYPAEYFFDSLYDIMQSQDIEDFLPDYDPEVDGIEMNGSFPCITEAQLRERVKQKLEWIEAFEAHVIKRDGALPSICGPDAPALTDAQTPKNSSEIQ